MLIQVCWSSCIEKVGMKRDLCGIFCGTLCAQELVVKLKVICPVAECLQSFAKIYKYSEAVCSFQRSKQQNETHFFTGWPFLQDDLSYRKIHPTGRHTLQEDRFYCFVCIIRGIALLNGMSYRWKCLTGVHIL